MTTAATKRRIDEWEAHAQHDVGLLIRSYLEQRKPPRGSDLARRLKGIATDLVCGGNVRLACLHIQSMRESAAPTVVFPDDATVVQLVRSGKGGDA